MGKFSNAFKAFFTVLKGNEMPTIKEDQNKQLESGKEDSKKEERLRDKFDEGAIYALLLLQREGRLIDFLRENIDAYEDEQIGAVVREIHTGCNKVLSDNFNVQAIFDSPEGESIEIAADFDPSEIKFTGEVPETAPYNGKLEHKGWIVKEIKLAARTGKGNTKVICPAEISFE